MSTSIFSYSRYLFLKVANLLISRGAPVNAEGKVSWRLCTHVKKKFSIKYEKFATLPQWCL